jgi:transposase InsO family protein
MDKDIQNKIGLFRHKIISPVLMESGRSQVAYFKMIERREFDVPGIGPKKFKASTMKNWLNLYRKHGFIGITPKIRSDKGSARVFTKNDIKKIKDFRSKYLELPVTLFYEKCLADELLGNPPVCYSSLVRFLKQENLFKRKKSVSRKRYEMNRFGELWVGDFCHGPKVKDGKRKRKAILLAIIDDHSRYIVGATFAYNESTKEVENVFKEAILSFGMPDRLYVDNGPSFSSNYLANACAQLNIGLVHSKPYDSPSRGKIERFFRTVRDRFFKLHEENELTLEEMNSKFQTWLQKDYLMKKHSSIKVRPWDRYDSSTKEYPLKRVSSEELDEYFMSTFTRGVRKDSTVSIDAIFYEVPANYSGMRVEIRFVQSNHPKYFLYENDRRICELKAVDSRANGKTYRPTKRDNSINFHNDKKE